MNLVRESVGSGAGTWDRGLGKSGNFVFHDGVLEDSVRRYTKFGLAVKQVKLRKRLDELLGNRST